MSLGPGLPDPPAGIPVPLQSVPHSFANNIYVAALPILGGLHHEYGLVQQTV